MILMIFSLVKLFLPFSCIKKFNLSLNTKVLQNRKVFLLIYMLSLLLSFLFYYVKSAAHLPEIPQETVNECKAKLEKNPSKDLFMDCTR